MQRTARCACGSASISVRGEPTQHSVCHCGNCMRRTGSALGVSTYFQRSDVVGRSGDMLVYAFHHAEMNHDQERHFCAKCGTTLFWFMSTRPQLVGVAGGCFAGEGLGEPTMSTWHSLKLPWITLPDGWIERPFARDA
jgi:hypothetical protein